MKLHLLAVAIPLVTFTLLASEANAPGVRAPLEPAAQRKAAPEIPLQNASGKAVNFRDYRGKIVLLDFWATWCHGCKEEIPWFSDLHRKYSEKGLVVVGVSMDSEGWKVVKPFAASANIPYTIVMGNDAAWKPYNLEALPDTFLIDREGRIAAAYRGLVDRNDIESNVAAMLRP